MGYPRPKYFFFWSTKSFASKNQAAADFFFLWSKLHLGKLPRLEANAGIVLKHRKCFCSRNIENAFAVERCDTED
jgi:hypothetical protein